MKRKSKSVCRVCGKPLKDDVSVALGIGPKCRVMGKDNERQDKTINMFASRADYVHGLDVSNKIVSIADIGGLKSVTSDIDNILTDIANLPSLKEVGGLEKCKVMYQDSDGIWDGVTFKVTYEQLMAIITGVAFFPLTEKDFEKAKHKLILR